YRDRWIELGDDAVAVRGYYFPWGTKRIPYTSIRGLERFDLTLWSGKGWIWGSGDFRHWANLDPERPRKSVGFSLDRGRHVVPLLTPDDPEAFEPALRSKLPPAPPA